ncbi:hypothetical protein J2W58_004248, partial [Pseudomonas psychrotolerans]|nr:hypothetical protein [Pseudomonas psychrotolerans]
MPLYALLGFTALSANLREAATGVGWAETDPLSKPNSAPAEPR